jgi:hypothetical protein
MLFSQPAEISHNASESITSVDADGWWLSFQLSEWIILIKGLPFIIGHNTLLETLRQGPVAVLIIPQDKMLGMIDDNSARKRMSHSQIRSLSEAIRKQSFNIHTAEKCQSAIKALEDVLAELSRSHDTALAFGWPMRVDPGYQVLLEERRTEALLVFAYYCAVLYLMSSKWFTKG